MLHIKQSACNTSAHVCKLSNAFIVLWLQVSKAGYPRDPAVTLLPCGGWPMASSLVGKAQRAHTHLQELRRRPCLASQQQMCTHPALHLRTVLAKDTEGTRRRKGRGGEM